jgi:hypothetical protein
MMEGTNEAGNEPDTPQWAVEEWKSGRWIVFLGQTTDRKIYGPSFGAAAEIFDSEEAAQAVADRLNAAEEENS